MSANEIGKDLSLRISIRSVQLRIRASTILQYKSLKCGPVLTAAHKLARCEIARKELLYSNANWDCTVFSDEKNGAWMVLMALTVIGMISEKKKSCYQGDNQVVAQ